MLLLDFVSFVKHHNLHHVGKVCGENMEGKVIKRQLRYDLMYVKGFYGTGIGGGGGGARGGIYSYFEKVCQEYSARDNPER